MRQLAAIMFTDIVGYSAMMSKDEKHAMAMLVKNRGIHKAAIEKFHGQYIKEIGDGTLSIFQSSVDAVNCALEIQEACCAEQDFQVRIGIHIGDIIFEENDVFGDGVNIASRIESSGQPGGIYFSERVYDDIKNKKDINVKYAGVRRLKNIEEPVKIYSIEYDAKERLEKKATYQKRKQILWITGMFLFGAVMTFFVIFLLDKYRTGREEKANVTEKSIAVLPLHNWGQDKEHAYLGDAVADEIILQLSKISELRVLSLTSTLRYKTDPKPISQIAAELGVNYILEGGIQRHDNDLSIRIQLLRAKNEDHLWRKEYNGKWEDIFVFQDEIAINIANQLETVLSPEEEHQIGEQPTGNFEAYRLYLKGMNSSRSEASNYFKQAIKMDSNYALAWAGLAYNYCLIMWYDPPSMELYPSAKEAAFKALELDNNLSEAYSALGGVYLVDWNWGKAEENFIQAIRYNPNISSHHIYYGLILTYTGRYDQALTEMQKAVKLDPLSVGAVNNLGMVYISSHNYNEVIKITEEALQIFSIKNVHTYLGQAYLYKKMYPKALDVFTKQGNEFWMGITYAERGEVDKAQEILNNLLHKEKIEYVSPFLKSLLLFSLKMDDKGFEALEKAYEIHDLELTEITTYPLLDRVSSDPRYLALLKKMGLK
jgi:adenylate cyclase